MSNFITIKALENTGLSDALPMLINTEIIGRIYPRIFKGENGQEAKALVIETLSGPDLIVIGYESVEDFQTTFNLY